MIDLLRILVARLRAAFSFQSSDPASSRHLAAERLEPRILYSAAPVEAPVVATETPVQEAAPAPVAESATAPDAAPAPVSDEMAGADVSVAEEAETTDVAADQTVALVDVDEPTATLNQQTVEMLAAEAKQRWIDSGISAEQIAALNSVSYGIADVGGSHLGVANGFTITIDDDAGGTGADNWFIDTTPGADEEFGLVSASAASGRYDLLSTLIHEQGHVLGLGDVFGSRTNVMDGLLDAGTRRLPEMEQADGVVAGSLTGEHFLTANLSRITIGNSGEQATGGGSFNPSFSPFDRFVVFESDASNLVSGDTNGQRDVFIQHLASGFISRVNTDASNQQSSGGDASHGYATLNGTHVVFDSSASDLVGSDTNGVSDVFVKDRSTDMITRANTNAADEQSTGGDAVALGISVDGNMVLFGSSADDLVPDDTNGAADLFLKNLQTGAISRVNTNASDEQAVGHGAATAISGKLSGDGNYVVFGSAATNLVAGDTNGNFDIFRKDLTTGDVVRVDTNSAGEQTAAISGGISSSNPSISSNGRYVVFRSEATDLVADDTNGLADIFVKDLVTGGISRVNVDALGGEATGGESASASISADGRFVVFSSLASNLVVDDTNGTVDTFVKDLRTGQVERLTVNAAAEEGTGAAGFGGNTFVQGTNALFASDATNLVDDDSNGEFDLFLSDFSPTVGDFSTSVLADENGNLVISGSSSVDDDLLIEVKNDRLEVSDQSATIGGPIVGSLPIGDDGRGVSIELAAFTGNIIVRTNGGDDRVTLGDLNGIPGGVMVEGGSGEDVVEQSGSIALLGASSLSFEAEQIRLATGAAIDAEDGSIDLRANQGNTSTVKSIGLMVEGSTITTTGSGEVNLWGIGGVVGSGNIGVVLNQTQVNTGGGNLIVNGSGGDGRNSNEGVRIGRGTTIMVAGGGNFDTFGSGDGSGSNNRGVFIDRDAHLQSADGRLLIRGFGAAGTSSNIGVQIQQATVVNTGDVWLEVRGWGGGSGSKNVGTVINGATIRMEGSGELGVLGDGSTTATGSSNLGVDLKSATIASVSEDFLRVIGNGGSGTSGNTALRAVKSSISNATGEVFVVGNVSEEVSKNRNRGLDFSSVSLSAATDLKLTGRAGGGISGNEAARLISSTLMAGSEIEVKGEGSNLTTGTGNRGLYIKNLEATGGRVGMTGEGGAGTHRNEGLRLIGATVVSTSTGAGVAGVGSDATSGNGNFGANISRLSIDAQTFAQVTGRGGTGVNANFGLLVRDSMLTSRTSTASFTGFADQTTTGRGNYGTLAINTDLKAATDITIIAGGGGGTNDNSGLTIRGGNFVADGTTGDSLTVFGSAKPTTTGSSNYGVYLNRASFTAKAGVKINSIAGAGTNGNYGTQLRRVSVSSEMGEVDIDGQGTDGTTGKGNYGTKITTSNIEAARIMVDGTGSTGSGSNYGTLVTGGAMTSTNGYVVVSGSAKALATGSANSGATLRNVTLTAVGDGLTVSGDGGGGVSNNYGARVDGGSFTSDAGSVIFSGSANSATTGSGNYGMQIKRSILNSVSHIDFRGTGGGGTSNNFGLLASGVVGDSGAGLMVSGNASAGTNGKNNRGAVLSGARLSIVTAADISGNGGGGTSNNQGVRIVGGFIESSLGDLSIVGIAAGSTDGTGNSGVYMSGRGSLMGGMIDIEGTGGGGTGANHGIFMNGGISVTALTETYDGTAGAGVASEDETGGFFP